MRKMHVMLELKKKCLVSNFVIKGIVEIPQIFCIENKPGYFDFYTYSHN